jgi:sugar diacid utilization regulator
MSDVQGLVDALAAVLDRPVGLDDHRFRALAYSSHRDRVDQVRRDSILRREAPQEVTSWLESLGVRAAERFVRVPAHEGFAMSARVCVPVRFDGTLLGFLWLFDEPSPLSEVQLQESVRYAEELAVAIYRARVLEQDSRERERELIALVIGAGESAERAAAELIGGGHLVVAPAYVALVLQAHHRDGGQAPDSIRVRLADGAEHLRRTVAPHHVLVLVGDGEVVAVLAPVGPEEVDRRAEALAASAAQALAAHPQWEIWVGVGQECDSLDALGASYQQARAAVRVARALGRPQPVGRWSQLGAYRTIVSLLGEGDAAGRVPDSLHRLLACDDAVTLTQTLECYLDLGGDARAAAAALFVHRSSLYGRLRRIEEIADVDLHSGEDRLELHLGIRLLRLAGGLDAPTGVESTTATSRRKSHPEEDRAT